VPRRMLRFLLPNSRFERLQFPLMSLQKGREYREIPRAREGNDT